MKSTTITWLEEVQIAGLTFLADVLCTAEDFPPHEIKVESVKLHRGDVEIDILPVLSDEVVERLRIKAFAEE